MLEKHVHDGMGKEQAELSLRRRRNQERQPKLPHLPTPALSPGNPFKPCWLSPAVENAIN